MGNRSPQEQLAGAEGLRGTELAGHGRRRLRLLAGSGYRTKTMTWLRGKDRELTGITQRRPAGSGKARSERSNEEDLRRPVMKKMKMALMQSFPGRLAR